MCLNEEKNIYKMYTKILFNRSDIDSHYPLYSRVKLEKHLGNLRFPQCCCFKTANSRNIPKDQYIVYSKYGLIFAVPIGTRICIVFDRVMCACFVL